MSIFLSYSRRDSELVNRLYDDLRARGADVWMDRNAIEAGSLWRTSIVEGIQNCRVFLLVVSAASQKSKNVAKEVSLAESNGKPILPLKVDTSPIELDFSYSLAGIQFIDMSQKGYDHSFLELVNVIQQFLLTHPEDEEEPMQELSRKAFSHQDDSLAAEPSPVIPPQTEGLDSSTPERSSPISDELLVSLEQVVAEELGPIVQLLWSRNFALDLLKRPAGIVAKLQDLGVPEDTAVRLRQRLQPFLSG
ncbi:MAG: toll/interleukin-1 receptor domain-containing protein [Synechococcaceae cyanobacterium]|nr:toll/interleukin-1 receptor domain-containing protein [Synechococcaceae cyanobacterium]